MTIDINELRYRLHYDPETGHFTKADGKRRGCITTHGYREIYFKGKRYKEHRLAWFYVHGKWPDEQIDHITGDREDNRMSNLREVSLFQNRMNRNKGFISSLGFLGVETTARTDRFYSRIVVRGKRHYLGVFDTARDAAMAYDRAAIYFHDGYASTNFSLGLL